MMYNKKYINKDDVFETSAEVGMLMKKFCFAFLSVAVFGFLLSGCAGEASTPDESQFENDASSDKADPDDRAELDALPEEIYFGDPLELESLFLDHPIFITSHSQDGPASSNLRANERYWEFEHVIFPADAVTDEDIMNWARVYLSEYGGEAIGVINLDNGNQLMIQVFSSHVKVNDSFTIHYQPQPDQDWFIIATGFYSFGLGDTSIQWLTESPFQ